MIYYFHSIVIAVLLWTIPAGANTRYHPCLDAPLLGPGSSANNDHEITVESERELVRAVNNAQPNTTIFIKPGRYELSTTLSVTQENITIRGASDDCSSVELIGAGMDNSDHGGVEHGFWIEAKNTTIANMTISELYLHPISVSGSSRGTRIFNVRMVNAGQQFVKVNPIEYGVGVDDGSVEYSIMQYTDSPPTISRYDAGSGYTNGIDIHAGKDWKISNNVFMNFHTPDTADHLWNAAVLVWNGASDTITENNVFINTDRAIAYGLTKRSHDHKGGVIRNNMIVMTRGLYSKNRSREADASILVWDSPGTVVVHNTILTNENIPYSIEVRFNNSGIDISNNVSDAPMGIAKSQTVRSTCADFISCRKNFISINKDKNEMNADLNWFISPESGDLRLKSSYASKIKKVALHTLALKDIDGTMRQAFTAPGADAVSID